MVVARNKILKLNLDHFFNSTVHLYQAVDCVKTSMDTILLSASVDARRFKNGKKFFVLDVGSGIGGGDVLLANRLDNAFITGMEIQKDLIDIACKNSKKNFVEDRVNFINADICDCGVLKKDGFDWVMTNPPFNIGETSPFQNKSLSYTEGEISLQKWIEFCAKNVRNSGCFSIIHKAERLDDILNTLKVLKFGRINVFPVFTKPTDKYAKRVIVTAQKGSKSPSVLHKEISEDVLEKILQNPIDIYR